MIMELGFSTPQMTHTYLTPPTVTDWIQIGDFLREEGQWNCTVMYEGEICTGKHEEGHHGIWGGDYSKGKAMKQFTDVIMNYQPSCHNCNVVTKKADREENRKWNIRRQYEAGFDVLEEWMKLPEKYRMANQEIERMIRQEML